MADRIDIFGDGTGIAEPEVPTFLGVEQEKLTKSQYQSQYTNFFSQYYGIDSLGSGLGDTGINVDDDKDDITELTTPGIKDEGDGGQEFFSNIESLTSDPGGGITTGFYGEAPSELTIKGDAYATAQQFNSYGDYLKTTEFTDRVPMAENFYDPLFSGNFKDIDFVEAFTGTYEGVKTDVQEAPSKVGDLISAGLKGELTAKQTETLVSGLFASTGNPIGMAISMFTSGDTLKDSYGRNTFRPSNPLLGLAFDLNMANEFAVAANVKAAQTVARELSLVPGQIDTGFRGLFGPNGKIDRNPNSGYYRINNVPGMTQKMAKAYDAFSKGLTHTSFDPTTGRGTTLEEAGFVPVGYIGHDGKDLSGKKGVGGYYTDKGTYVDKFGRGAQYGTTASVSAAAAKAGITYDEMMSAIQDARKGNGTVGSNVKSIQQDKLNKAEAARQKAEADARAAAAADQSQRELARASGGGGGGQSHSGNEAGYGAGGSHGLSHARGGKVGYAFGTPEGGVQAPSGFIDAPPSQVAEGQKVADNRDMKVKEGTYVLNAAAVEFAGEQDIRKMIMDAQKEAVRRGLSTEDFERHSDLIDIAVSSGEVTIAPHLVKIIGEDRLEKINNRGLRKTEERIAQNGQQPTGAAEGGFIQSGSEIENLYTGPTPQPIGFDIVDERIRKLGPQGYGILSEKDIRLEEQSRINPTTPSMTSTFDKQSYRKGVEFGDTEAGFSLLGRTNYNNVLLSGLRDTRTLSDFVKTLDLNEDIAGYFGLNPAGAYRENINRVLIKSPENFATARSRGMPLSYDAVLGHELMHKGADALAKDPNFNPNETLVQAQKAWKVNEESRKDEIGGNTPEHRYIQSVINEAYMLRDVDSVLGSLEKQKRTKEPVQDFEIVYGEDGKVEFEPYFRQVNESDLANAKKKGLIKELRRSFDNYMTEENREQFLSENKDYITLGRAGILFKDTDVPFTTVAGVFRSLNKIMAQDYAAQLFEKAIANKPIEVQRKPDRNPQPQVASEPTYERGFLEKTLGISSAY